MCYGEALSAAVVRARKKHSCDDCGRRIEPGRHYRREAMVDGRELISSKLCRTCACATRKTLDELPRGECVWYGSGESRAELRKEPWRETLRWMRETWAHLRRKEATHGS